MGSSASSGKPTNTAETLCPYAGQGPWFSCGTDASVEPRLAAGGPASAAGCPPTTLPRLLTKAAQRHGGKPAMKVERPVPELQDGKAPAALPLEEWATWSFEEYLASVRSAAKAFVKLGLERHGAVGIWGFNAPEWVISAFAASFAGGKIAGLYPTDSPDTAAYKVVQSGASVVVVEDSGKLKRLLAGLDARADCTRLRAIVAYGFEPAEGELATVAGGSAKLEVPVLGFKALLAMGREQGSDEELDARVEATQPGDCAALIYTSGTTGEPKAVMISHDNIIFESSNVKGILRSSCGFAAAAEQERMLSYLPLSHVAGMMVDIVSPVVCSTEQAWVTTFFARGYDLKTGSLRERLVAVKPTVFIGVPLVWEKIADKIRTAGSHATGLQKCVAGWARSRGLEYASRCQVGGSFRKPQGFRTANRVVLSKVKASLGLECCKFGGTGAAPIRVDTLEFFGSLGLNINEIYGMSESTGACTWSTDQAHQWGACGWEMPGLEVRAFRMLEGGGREECPRAPGLEAAGDERFQGELCFRGRSIMMGYMANPDLGEEHVQEVRQKTAEAIDAEGWLHSGDKGMITEDGMVRITGRYKEIIIGDGGENIAPVPIEDHVKKACDGIAEIMMVGDKRKYNVALVTLKAVGANGEAPGGDELDAGARRVSPEAATITQAMDDRIWIQTVTDAITSANKNTKVCINNAFTIQKFTILPQNFSEQNNELTPTKKLKRKVVEVRYSAMIERMYATSGTYIRFTDA